MLQRSALASLIVLALAGSAAAQPLNSKPDWDYLSGLAPGSEIRIFLADGKQVRGYLQRVTSDTIAINAPTSQELVPRTQVRRVQLKRDSHRRRNTLIGFGVGAGTGLVAGGILDSKASDFLPNAGKIAFGSIGALLGTGIGAAWPTGGWRNVYRAQ
jgi:hypothetical protein